MFRRPRAGTLIINSELSTSVSFLNRVIRRAVNRGGFDLRGQRIVLLVATAAATLFGTFGALRMIPVYKAQVTALPVDNDRQGALAGLAGQLGGLAALTGVSIGYESTRRNSLFAGWESVMDQRDSVAATYSFAGDSVR